MRPSLKRGFILKTSRTQKLMHRESPHRDGGVVHACACLIHYPGDQSTLFLSEKSPLKSGNYWPLGQRVHCSKVAVPGDLLLFCSILFQQLDDANYK